MPYIIGPDVSFYQDNPETARQIDFNLMRNNGARFVIIRAGQNIWVDPDFAFNWSYAKAAGLPRGSYWLYDSRIEPRRQAELYINQLGRDLGELPLFADFEESYGGVYRGWQNWKLFLERLKQLAPGKKIGIYTAYYYWRDNAPPVGSADLGYFHQYPLWVANYGVVVPLVPAPWTNYIFHQFTNKGDGLFYGAESLEIDLNKFNGTEEDFRNYLENVELPPVPQEPVEAHIIDLYPGIDFHKVYRYDSWVCVVISKGQTYKVTRFGQKTVSRVARETGAPVVFNGGGYTTAGAVGLHIADGIVYNGQLEYEPFANASQNSIFGIYRFNESASKYNALAGKRLIVENGQISPNTSSAWHEVHPRTLDGVRADGARIQITVDGRQPGYSSGVNLFDAARIMMEFGAIRATDKDGGGSTAVAIDGVIVNRPIDGNIPGKERAVGTHDLIFLSGETPPEGEPMTFTRGTVKPGAPNTNVKLMSTGQIVAALRWEPALNAGDSIYGQRNVTPNTTDLIKFTKIYRADGSVHQLPGECKAVIINLTLTDNVEEPGTQPPPPPPADPTIKHRLNIYSNGSYQVDDGPIIP